MARVAETEQDLQECNKLLEFAGPSSSTTSLAPQPKLRIKKEVDSTRSTEVEEVAKEV